jgi:hypothetical protein
MANLKSNDPRSRRPLGFWGFFSVLVVVTFGGAVAQHLFGLVSWKAALIEVFLSSILLLALLSQWVSARWARSVMQVTNTADAGVLAIIVLVNEVNRWKTERLVMILDDERLLLQTKNSKVTIRSTDITEVKFGGFRVFFAPPVVLHTFLFGAIEIRPLLSDGVLTAGNESTADLRAKIAEFAAINA